MKQRCLPWYELETGIDAILVTGIEEVERPLRRGGSVVLPARFYLQVVQCVQVILNLLKLKRLHSLVLPIVTTLRHRMSNL